MIREIFTEADAERICSLALSLGGQQDRQIWLGNANGVFSIRSAYHLENDRLLREYGESSQASASSEVWRQLWKLRVPGMVHNFLWRACNNLLPTKVALFKKRITSDPLCPLCGLASETTDHILWDCASSTAVWAKCSRKIQKLSIVESDGLCLFEQLLSKLNVDDLEFVACLARSIWLRRNSVVFGGIFTPPD